jgi:hypothetical protein
MGAKAGVNAASAAEPSTRSRLSLAAARGVLRGSNAQAGSKQMEVEKMQIIATKNWDRRVALALILAGTLQAAGLALAHDRVVQRFTDAGGSGANGRVRFTLRNDADGRLEIRVRGLAPDQTFDVLAGTVRIGTLRTTGGGSGALRFRSRPRGRDVLLGFDPRGAVITIRDANGNDVLVAPLPTTPNSNDASKVACCKADDGGSECEDRTVDECMAEGGVPAAAASCLPNPCDNAAPPPATKVICCEPDDDGVECEDRKMADCAARGGTVVEATSCTPNPCVGVPPADVDIQCCLPDDSGSECEDRTPEQCAAQGGTNMGPGTCNPNPCSAATTPTPGVGDDRGGSGGTYYGATATPAADDHGGGRGGEDGAHRHGGH